MFEKIAKKISKEQAKKPLFFIGAFIIITVLLLPGILQLVDNVEPSLEKVLPQNIDEVQTMNQMRADFGADMMYILIYADGVVADVRDPAVVEFMDTTSQLIRQNEYIVSVDSLADVVKVNNDGQIPNSVYAIREITHNLPQTERYLNDDYSLAVIYITSDTGASAQLIDEVVSQIEYDLTIIEEYDPGTRVELTGFNTIDKATFEVIMSDFASITLLSFALVALVVFLTFRSIKKGVLPLVIVLVALLWTMGIAGYLQLTLTVVSMVAAAMIMGLGIDFGVHVTHTYFEYAEKKKPKDALHETLKELLRAMTGASMTTMAGFLALLFGVLPAMKILAIILAIGILNTLLGAVLLLPVLLYVYDRNRRKTK